MKKIFATSIFFLLLSALFGVQYVSDKEKARAQYVEPMILRPDLVKAIDLGLHNAASDLMWLAAIQYFGGGESNDYSRLPQYLEFSSDLDPKFSYPYAFGALLLPSIGYLDEGLALADKGIKNKTQDWRIAYYAATTYYINLKDDAKAAKYFDIAANTPGIPENIKGVAARFGNRPDRIEQTKQIWMGIYETTDDEVVKKRAENYIIHLEIVKLLNDAKEQYHKMHNQYPKTADDLVAAKLLKFVPDDPFGFTFEFDEKGNLFSR